MIIAFILSGTGVVGASRVWSDSFLGFKNEAKGPRAGFGGGEGEACVWRFDFLNNWTRGRVGRAFGDQVHIKGRTERRTLQGHVTR